MAGSASITRRKTKSGLRYAVRYRRGGRLFPGLHGGSFKTQREARERRDLILGELAAGRDPADKLRAAPTVRVTLAQWSERYVASRVDLAPSTALNAEVALKQILPTFGDRDPSAITWQDVQSWIGSLALKPSSVSQYLATFRAVLDFAESIRTPHATARQAAAAAEGRDRRADEDADAGDPCRRAAPVPPAAGRAGTDRDARRRAVPADLGGRGRGVVAVPGSQGQDGQVPPLGRRARERHAAGRRQRPLRRPDCRAASVPRLHARRGQERDGPSLQGGWDRPVQPPRPAPPLREHPDQAGGARHDLAAQLGHSRTSMTLDVYSHVVLDD